MTNYWDNTYSNQIIKMLNEAADVTVEGEEPNYRSLDIHFSYSLNLGFPMLTMREVEFDYTRNFVEACLKKIGKAKIDKIIDTLIPAVKEKVEVQVAKNTTVVFEKIKDTLTLIINVNESLFHGIPEQISAYALLLTVFARSIPAKNLVLQYNTIFCNATKVDLDNCKGLLSKETYEAPTLVMDKDVNAYNYTYESVSLKNYKFSK